MSSTETEADVAPDEPDTQAPEADPRPFRERVAEGGAQVIAFKLGGELHACDVRLVAEVVARRAVHRLPDMPPRLLGVLRLRDELIPVLDVAPLLEMALEETERPAVLVVPFGEARIGVAADAADEVVSVPAEAFRPAPHTGAERDAYVVGLARLEGRLVNLIDLAEILRAQATPNGEER